MRIESIEVTHDVAPPRARPIRDALQVLDGGGTVHVTVRARDGLRDVVTGTSSTGFGRMRKRRVTRHGTTQIIVANRVAPNSKRSPAGINQQNVQRNRPGTLPP